MTEKIQDISDSEGQAREKYELGRQQQSSKPTNIKQQTETHHRPRQPRGRTVVSAQMGPQGWGK